MSFYHQIDVCALHWYGLEASDMITYVTDWHNTFGCDIFLTEYAVEVRFLHFIYYYSSFSSMRIFRTLLEAIRPMLRKLKLSTRRPTPGWIPLPGSSVISHLVSFGLTLITSS